MLGEVKRRPAKFDKELVQQLKNVGKDGDAFKIHTGTTMCTYDFYEGLFWLFILCAALLITDFKEPEDFYN